jgi:hypothetical protein
LDGRLGCVTRVLLSEAGAVDGVSAGILVGMLLRMLDGLNVGTDVLLLVGIMLGSLVKLNEGAAVGANVLLMGLNVGVDVVGLLVKLNEGAGVGANVLLMGLNVGVDASVVVGEVLGLDVDGVTVGCQLGTTVG